MNIFDRYVLRQSASAVLLILFSLVGVVWIAMALKQLKLVTTKGQDVVTMLVMTTLAIPNLLGLIAPIALLIAAIHTLNRLNSDSELIVLTASGANTWRVARPLLVLAFLVSMAVAAVNHFAMPWSLKSLRQKITEVQTDLISQVLQPGRFSSPMSGIVVHIRDRARDGTLLGVLITDNRKPDAALTYLARYGQIQKSGGTSFLAMKTGHVLRKEIKGKPGNHPPEILEFDTYAVDLEQFERKAGRPRLRPRELYFGELLAAIRKPPERRPPPRLSRRKAETPAASQQRKKKRRKKRRRNAGRGAFIAELHERFSSPLYPFVFVLFAVAFVGRAQSTRTNQTKAMALAFLTAALFRLAGMASGNLATIQPLWAPLLYAVPITGIATAVLMIVRGNSSAPSLRTPPIVDAFVRGVTRWGGALLPWPARPQAKGG